jgi:hypothetical protein
MNNYLYHGTLLENWNNIRKQGLLPKQIEDSNVWYNGNKVRSVCLVKDPRIAEMFALRKRYSLNKGTPIILKINNINSLIAKDEKLGLRYNVVLNKIYPKNIMNYKIVKIDNLKMLKFFKIQNE